MTVRSTLALIFGGASPEHEVSLVSAKGILANLDRARYDVTLVGVTRDGRPHVGDEALLDGGLDRDEGVAVRWPASPADRTLRREDTGEPVTPPIEVAFPIIHGETGEDGVLQGVLAWAGVRCVGAGVLGSSLAMDKDRARRMLAAAGIPVVDDVVLRGAEAEDLEGARRRVEPLGLPVFVKPARAGSSVGITKVRAWDQLGAAIAAARAIDPKVVVEQAVPEPRELEVAVLGGPSPSATRPGEIVPHGEFYSYESKYDDPESKLLIPAPIEDGLAVTIRGLALDAFAALELAGFARVDFLLSKSTGELVLNEINTLPGFTPISMYPRLWESEGLSYPRLIDRLIELAE